MGKLAELRQRIQAVENIQAVTRTLATVAAAKLSRTHRRAAGMRVYARRVRDAFQHQQAYMSRTGLDIGTMPFLLARRGPVNRVALLVITADRGMCGGYNLEVCRRALEVWERSKRTGTTVRFVLRGRRGIGYFQRRQADIVHRETWRREGFSGPDVERLLGVLLELYRSGRVDAVDVVYTEFRSPIHRVPRVVRLLPIELPASELPAERVWRWYHEPGFAAVVEELLAIYLRVQLCDVLLESYASEQGARMITMQEASERAGKTLQEYRVLHHRLRREAITVDLLQTLFASRAARGGGASAVPAGPA